MEKKTTNTQQHAPITSLLVCISSFLTASYTCRLLGMREKQESQYSVSSWCRWLFCKWQLKLVILKVTLQKISFWLVYYNPLVLASRDIQSQKKKKKTRSPWYPKENGADRLVGPCFGYRISVLCNIEIFSEFFFFNLKHILELYYVAQYTQGKQIKSAFPHMWVVWHPLLVLSRSWLNESTNTTAMDVIIERWWIPPLPFSFALFGELVIPKVITV